MEQFTFGVLAYNVEKYIIECLESIKYQIQHFGSEYECKLIVAEDCSTDNTLKLIEGWVHKNNGLFLGGVEILKHPVNQGLVKNIISLYKKIDTPNFKVIDGDDIFYKNNVFDLLGKNDVVITTTLHFQNGYLLNKSENYHFYRLFKQKKILDYLKESYKYRHILETPGVFFSGNLLGESLFNAMRPYKMLDDIPRWKHIFNQEGLSVRVSEKPYVLYRIGSGVSLNVNNEKRKDFDIDVVKWRKQYVSVSYLKERYNRLKFSCFKRMTNFYYKKRIPALKNLIDNIKRAEQLGEGNAYLRHIIENSNIFLEEIRKK